VSGLDERLARADPVRRDRRAPDAVLLARILADRRAPRRRQRPAIAVALLALVAVVVPTAVALRTGALDFAAAERAPAPVVRSFASLEHGSPLLRPGVIAGETRKVLERGHGRVVLWVAPTRSGGFCWTVSDRSSGHSSGGCGRREGGRMHAQVPFSQAVRDGNVYGTFEAVVARVRDRRMVRLAVRHEDGLVLDVPIVWVSEPIGVGFAVHVVPPARWVTGRPTAVLAYGRDGAVLKREPLERRQVAPPRPQE
jgi:hypothetical protein